MPSYVFHVLPNAHLDPVWLWDWREGLNEGLVTCRAVLDLMDDDPQLTFVRGEAAIYDHIERTDPATFQRIRRYVQAGRWDVVGGTWIQPDTNLPATETFARHLLRGQRYFLSRFGRTVRVAWAADSFGHSAGLPEIFASAGIESFAFTRPFAATLPLAQPAFWWKADSGARILAYRPMVGWYGTEHDEVPRRFDATLEAAARCDLTNVGCFIGLGDHGGGPTRRQIADVRAWAARHPEVKVIFSGFHRFFDALRAEAADRGEGCLPTHLGELNFTLRGCYTSVARFKFAYRRTEAAVARSERVDAAIRAATVTPAAELGRAWDAVLFNSFHDILPGSSIERTYDDQLAALGGAYHASQQTELAALNALAMRVDTTVPQPRTALPAAVPLLVWNPHPFPCQSHVELEACLDDRPIKSYDGRPQELPVEVRSADGQLLPFQSIRVENSCMQHIPWRWRVIAPLTLPPMGWTVVTMGWVEGARKKAVRSKVAAIRPGTITNGHYTLKARRGGRGVQVLHRGRPVFTGAGLGAVTVEDRLGSWGGDRDCLSEVRHRWVITHVEILESGPERALLWTRWQAGQSDLELTFSLGRGRKAVDVAARVLWNERSARLKLVMPGADRARFEVPGAIVERGQLGEVPGGRWVEARSRHGRFGFASDAIYGFDCTRGELRASLVRGSRFANAAHQPITPEEELWRPVERGELKFHFLLTPGGQDLPRLARQLQDPPLVLRVPATPGAWPRTGSLLELSPAALELLALKPADHARGWILRVQETTGRPVEALATWQGQPLVLGKVAGGRIQTWRLVLTGSTWRATPTSTVED